MKNEDLNAKCERLGINQIYLERQLMQKKVCMTKDVGLNDNLFGGFLLQWIDEAASGHISQVIGHRRVVTLKMSEVLFEAPVKVKDIISINGTITNVGKTSITMYVQVFNTRSQKEVCSTEMIFVHVDEQGNPTNI
jgi:acyl-CoA thioesterase YciA